MKTVNDYILAIENKTISINEIASKFNVSNRTIQSRIKQLGFEWVSKENVYRFVGYDNDYVNNLDFAIVIKDKSIVNENIMKYRKKDSDNKMGTAIANINANNNVNTSNFDKIINDEGKSTRTFKGFYLDTDVVKALENIPSKKKSDAVNELLRIALKEVGFLR